MRNKMELEYLQEISQMNLAIQQKEFELQSLIEAEEYQDKRQALESEIKTLKEKADSFTESKFKAAQALNNEIDLIQEIEMKDMDDAISTIKRIAVVLKSDSDKFGLCK